MTEENKDINTTEEITPEVEPVQTEPAETEPTEVEPAEAELVQTEPIKEGKKSAGNNATDNIKENLIILRESRKKLQKERDEYLARIKMLEQEQAKKNTPEYEDTYADETDPVQKEVKQLKQYVTELSANASRSQLRAQFPDFNKVVNEESIALLHAKFPSVADALDKSTDIYNTGVAAYDIIKKFGLNIDEDAINETNEQKQKVIENVNKPRPASSIKSQSPLSYAADYSDLERKEVRDEIMRIANERARNA